MEALSRPKKISQLSSQILQQRAIESTMLCPFVEAAGEKDTHSKVGEIHILWFWISLNVLEIDEAPIWCHKRKISR